MCGVGVDQVSQNVFFKGNLTSLVVLGKTLIQELFCFLLGVQMRSAQILF